MMARTVLVTLDKQRRLTEVRRRRDDLIWALQRKWKWSQKCASDRYGVVTNIINNMSWERLQEGRGALLEIQKTFKGRYHLNNRGGGWHHILWYNYRETKKKNPLNLENDKQRENSDGVLKNARRVHKPGMPTWRVGEEVRSFTYGRESSDSGQVSGWLSNTEIVNESIFQEATASEDRSE